MNGYDPMNDDDKEIVRRLIKEREAREREEEKMDRFASIMTAISIAGLIYLLLFVVLPFRTMTWGGRLLILEILVFVVGYIGWRS